jgi:hypothetical protein
MSVIHENKPCPIGQHFAVDMHALHSAGEHGIQIECAPAHIFFNIVHMT